MDFDIVIPFACWFRPSSDGSETIPESWAGSYFHTYVRLRDPGDAASVQRGLPAFTDRHVPQWITDQLQMPAHPFYGFSLVPVRDVHFDGAPIEAMKPGGSRTTVAALAGVAALILLIAGDQLRQPDRRPLDAAHPRGGDAQGGRRASAPDPRPVPRRGQRRSP